MCALSCSGNQVCFFFFASEGNESETVASLVVVVGLICRARPKLHLILSNPNNIVEGGLLPKRDSPTCPLASCFAVRL